MVGSTHFVQNAKRSKMSKYKKGDYVLIDKIFECVPHGQFRQCKPFIAKVTRVQHTHTCGNSYTLESNDHEFKICYWEEDIYKRVIK